MDKLGEAICFATKAFDGMLRKCGNSPAIFHSLEAAVIAQSVSNEEDAVIAAVLHDTVEDANVSVEEIRDHFGERVAMLVKAETEDKQPEKSKSDSWKSRKEATVNLLKSTGDLGIKAVCLGDKLSNIRSLYQAKQKLGNKMWLQFNQSDPNAHKWYYSAIAENLNEFSNTPAYREYVELIDKTFGGK